MNLWYLLPLTRMNFKGNLQRYRLRFSLITKNVSLFEKLYQHPPMTRFRNILTTSTEKLICFYINAPLLAAKVLNLFFAGSMQYIYYFYRGVNYGFFCFSNINIDLQQLHIGKMRYIFFRKFACDMNMNPLCSTSYSNDDNLSIAGFSLESSI